MKFVLLSSLVLFSFFSRDFFSYHSFQQSLVAIDTNFHHVVDGKDSEWPVQKFETDLPTGIQYAEDNDTQSLYLVLLIPDSRMQMKMMRNGMDLYLDLKGKRKESKGIEFPVKRDPSADNSMINYRNQKNDEPNEQESAEQKKANSKMMRAAMILNLTSIKVFGFAADESEEQGLKMPGSANIAFAWDSTDAMCIEYKIPFSLLGVSSPVAQKDINLGWKVNGFQRPADNASSAGSTGGRHGGGHSGGGHRNFNSGNSNSTGNSTQQGFENRLKDQSFWTKYTMQ